MALPPSENHLRGDFKNIPVILQDKSLITGNYGLPISVHPPTPPFFSFFFHQKPPASLLLSSHSTGAAAQERDAGLERGMGMGIGLLPGSRQ